MRTAHRLWRRGLARLRPSDRVASPRDDALLASTGEFEANDRELRGLLVRDGRDTADIPGFDDLADRQAELVELIVAMPALSLAGAGAKARCARLRPREQGFDAALELAFSACDDLLRLLGAETARELRFPIGLSRGAAAETGGGFEGSGLAEPLGRVRRFIVFRPDDAWRHLIDALIQVGVWWTAGATVLPFDGVHLRWRVVALLLALGGGASFLAFRLRHADRSD